VVVLGVVGFGVVEWRAQLELRCPAMDFALHWRRADEETDEERSTMGAGLNGFGLRLCY
jgi:hypothetical protein